MVIRPFALKVYRGNPMYEGKLIFLPCRAGRGDLMYVEEEFLE
jgi:hypothetical protein